MIRTDSDKSDKRKGNEGCTVGLHLHKMLKSGKCQLLLDRLDEVKYSEMEDFQPQLDELVDSYSGSQCVMSIRRFSIFVELSCFKVVWMLPFSPQQ